MKRAAFAVPLLAAFATIPARAAGRKHDMAIDTVLSDIKAKGARTDKERRPETVG